MTTTNPTRGQLERNLSQRIQNFYATYLGHRPTKVTCQLFDTKLAIVIENSITQPEQLLINQGQEKLAEQVRSGLDEAIEPQLKQLIEEVLDRTVLDLLSDVTLDTARGGIIAVLSDTPSVRNPEAIPKVKKNKTSVIKQETKQEEKQC